jgi:hypothetical protein
VGSSSLTIHADRIWLVSPAQTTASHVLAKLLSDRHSRARSRRFRLAHSGSIRRLCRRHRLSEARRACSTSCLAREGAMIEDCCVARQGRLTSLGRRCQHHAVITFTAFRRAGANSDRQNRHHKDGATSSLPPWPDRAVRAKVEHQRRLVADDPDKASGRACGN